MTMKKSNPITGITLEGFQVFDKPTHIPLERLTLLFGPNSAGKSAVQDAIELYEALLSDDANYDFYPENDHVRKLLDRHWRRTGGNNDQWVDRLSLGVSHTTQCDIHTSLGQRLNRKVWGGSSASYIHVSDAWPLESRWHFQRTLTEEKYITFTTSFEFLVENELLVKHSFAELVINLAHPFFSQTESKVDFAAVAKIYPDEVSLKDGLLTISLYLKGFHPKGIHSIELFGSQVKLDSNRDVSLLLSAIAELDLLLGEILRTASGNSRFKPIVVEASRKVPIRQELVFQLGHLDDQIEPLFPKLNPRYHRLAASIANLPIPNDIDFLWNREPLLSYGERINRALSDHLFIEQGYRIDHDSRVLMSKKNSRAVIAGDELDPSEFGYVVELFLRDGSNRKHLFEDVGSGIGYALPVLCAVFESNAFSSTCFIQQPELHIHPALQAAMGDVFIDASSGDKQILIETHSEHLLLRILKRIRQTHLQASIAPELKINADDVCVLYFNPLPDGTTTVKRLRITEDGEFMDRWPRGFFGERDQELLDE